MESRNSRLVKLLLWAFGFTLIMLSVHLAGDPANITERISRLMLVVGGMCSAPYLGVVWRDRD